MDEYEPSLALRERNFLVIVQFTPPPSRCFSGFAAYHVCATGESHARLKADSMVTPLDIRSRFTRGFEAEFDVRWKAVFDALAPIVGQHGVAAMWQRAVSVTSHKHPWLAANPLEGEALLDPVALLPTLVAQEPAIAAQAASDLSAAFQEILISLIGTRLSEQLLANAWMGPRALPVPPAPANDA